MSSGEGTDPRPSPSPFLPEPSWSGREKDVEQMTSHVDARLPPMTPAPEGSARGAFRARDGSVPRGLRGRGKRPDDRKVSQEHSM